MNTLRHIFFAFVFVVVCGNITVAEAANIDWYSGYVETIVNLDGDPSSRAVSMVNGRQDLLKAIGDMIVNENETAKTIIDRNSNTVLKLNYLIENLKLVNETDEEGNSVQKYRVPIYGISRSVISLLVPDSVVEKDFPDPNNKGNVENVKSEEEKSGKAQKPAAKSKTQYDYSGLIIDCRELQFEPLIFPTVKNDLGQVIYCKDNFDRGTLLSRGIAGFAAAEDKAADRVGLKPLIIKAAAIEQGTIVLGAEDADLILNANITCGFLRGAKVVILL